MAHRTGEILELKHRLARFLVEQEGFRLIAFETDWVDADGVEAYLQTDCSQDAADVLLQSAYDLWHTPTMAQLLEWLCAWNQDHPEDAVHFLGFNNFQPWHDVPALVAFADTFMGAAAAEVATGLADCYCADQASMDECPNSQTAVSAATYAACVGAIDAVETFADENEATVLETLSQEELETVRLHCASLRGWQDYQSIASETVPLTDGMASRDAAMAEIFLTLRERRHPGAKTVLSAHSMHVVTGAEDIECVYPQPAADYDWWEGIPRMGSGLSQALGDSYLATSIVSGSYWNGMISLEANLDGAPADPPIAEVLLAGLDRPLLMADLATDGSDPLLSPEESYLFGVPDSLPVIGNSLVLFESILSGRWGVLFFIDETTVMPGL